MLGSAAIEGAEFAPLPLPPPPPPESNCKITDWYQQPPGSPPQMPQMC